VEWSTSSTSTSWHAIAPWGEIFVASQGNGVISRFGFDSEHIATPSGSFETVGACTAPEGIAWLSIVP